jgi:hypothetical protein
MPRVYELAKSAHYVPESTSELCKGRTKKIQQDGSTRQRQSVGNLVLPYYSIVYLYSILNLPYMTGLIKYSLA